MLGGPEQVDFVVCHFLGPGCLGYAMSESAASWTRCNRDNRARMGSNSELWLWLSLALLIGDHGR